MSEARKLHRGHIALLGNLKDRDPRGAYPRNGVVQIDGVHQDFLAAWYEELKEWSLIAAEDLLGRAGNKLGERITITDEGLDRLREATQSA